MPFCGITGPAGAKPQQKADNNEINTARRPEQAQRVGVAGQCGIDTGQTVRSRKYATKDCSETAVAARVKARTQMCFDMTSADAAAFQIRRRQIGLPRASVTRSELDRRKQVIERRVLFGGL